MPPLPSAPLDARRRARARRVAGVTLVELLVVLALLVGLATLVTVRASAGTAIELREGVTRSPKEVVSMATLTALRDAIVGEGAAAGAGYLADMGALPYVAGDLLTVPFELPAELQTFDPSTARGWRGPYTHGPSVAFEVAPAKGFLARYATDGALLPSDAWLAPIVLQYPDPTGAGPSFEARQFGRLVSAGENGVLETPRTDADVVFDSVASSPSLYPSLKDCGDDLVLYLLVPDQRLDNTDA